VVPSRLETTYEQSHLFLSLAIMVFLTSLLVYHSIVKWLKIIVCVLLLLSCAYGARNVSNAMSLQISSIVVSPLSLLLVVYGLKQYR